MKKDFSKQSRTEKYLYVEMLHLGLNPIEQYEINGMHVDFAFPDMKIAIEIDGPHHESSENKEIDKRRDEILKQLGWNVYRYSANYVHNNVKGIALHIKHRFDEAKSKKSKHRTVTTQEIYEIVRRDKRNKKRVNKELSLWMKLAIILIFVFFGNVILILFHVSQSSLVGIIMILFVVFIYYSAYRNS